MLTFSLVVLIVVGLILLTAFAGIGSGPKKKKYCAYCGHKIGSEKECPYCGEKA